MNLEWLKDVPTRLDKDGFLMLVPTNNEKKSVEEAAPYFKKTIDNMIASRFKGVLN